MQWNDRWTRMWHYYPDGRRLGLDPRRHLIHSAGDTPGIDVEVYAFWKSMDVKLLRFAFRKGLTLGDDSIGMLAALQTFDLVKMPFNAGFEYGPQWVCPRDASIWRPVRSSEDAEAVASELLQLAYGMT
jgi:hypothetical protein